MLTWNGNSKNSVYVNSKCMQTRSMDSIHIPKRGQVSAWKSAAMSLLSNNCFCHYIRNHRVFYDTRTLEINFYLVKMIFWFFKKIGKSQTIEYWIYVVPILPRVRVLALHKSNTRWFVISQLFFTSQFFLLLIKNKNKVRCLLDNTQKFKFLVNVVEQ